MGANSEHCDSAALRCTASDQNVECDMEGYGALRVCR